LLKDGETTFYAKASGTSMIVDGIDVGNVLAID